MYFARSRLLVLFLLIWLGGLVEVASAQHKYIFPQFVFGGVWASTLMVQASATPTTCTVSAQGRFLTMRNPSGNNISGTSIPLTFGMNGWTILKTAPPQGMTVSSGMAVLDCSEEVSANTLFPLEIGGSLVSEAVVKSPEEILSGESVAQFLADHRDGARFGVAVANPSNQPISVLVTVSDLAGQQIGNTTVYLPANDFRALFVDELLTNTDRTYRTGCDSGHRRVALFNWLEVHRTRVHHYSGDSVSSNHSNATASTNATAPRPKHRPRQPCRYGENSGDVVFHVHHWGRSPTNQNENVSIR